MNSIGTNNAYSLIFKFVQNLREPVVDTTLTVLSRAATLIVCLRSRR